MARFDFVPNVLREKRFRVTENGFEYRVPPGMTVTLQFSKDEELQAVTIERNENGTV